MGPFSKGSVIVDFGTNGSIPAIVHVAMMYEKYPIGGDDRKNYVISLGDTPSISISTEGEISIENPTGGSSISNEFFKISYTYSASHSNDEVTVSYTVTFTDVLNSGSPITIGTASIVLEKKE